jgi:hypothetical protein
LLPIGYSWLYCFEPREAERYAIVSTANPEFVLHADDFMREADSRKAISLLYRRRVRGKHMSQAKDARV